jgi:hypothetical protein
VLSDIKQGLTTRYVRVDAFGRVIEELEEGGEVMSCRFCHLERMFCEIGHECSAACAVQNDCPDYETEDEPAAYPLPEKWKEYADWFKEGKVPK